MQIYVKYIINKYTFGGIYNVGTYNLPQKCNFSVTESIFATRVLVFVANVNFSEDIFIPSLILLLSLFSVFLVLERLSLNRELCPIKRRTKK